MKNGPPLPQWDTKDRFSPSLFFRHQENLLFLAHKKRSVIPVKFRDMADKEFGNAAYQEGRGHCTFSDPFHMSQTQNGKENGRKDKAHIKACLYNAKIPVFPA